MTFQLWLRAPASGKRVLADGVHSLALAATGVAALFGAVAPPGLRAAEATGWTSSVHGFVQLNYAARPDFAASPDRDGLGDDGFVLGEERLQLKLEARSADGAWAALAKPEFYHDAVAERGGATLREGYADYAHGAWDVRLGRQIITWGVGDLVFIDDVFPKDYAAFFSGRPLEYLKRGVDALDVNYQSDSLSAELVVVPAGLFTPDNLPPRGRFYQFDPFPTLPRETQEPPARFDQTEVALRLHGTVADTELAVYAYRGFSRSGALAPDSATTPTHARRFFPRLDVFGASARRGGLGGVWSAEVGYYDARDDPRGDNPAIDNAQVRFLVAYQRQLAEDFTGSIEYYGEWMQDHAAYRRAVPPGFPASRKLRDLIGVRLTKFLRYQTLKLSLFTFYSPAARDFLANPEVSYQFSDRFSATLGGNIFGGPAQTFFGMLGRNDNAYLSARFSF